MEAASNNERQIPQAIAVDEMEASSMPASFLRRLQAVKMGNPLQGVTGLKSFFTLLKREAPKLVDVRSYSKPASFEQATTRLRANVSYFRISYSAVFVTVLLLFILSNPILFVSTIALIVMWSAFLSQPPDHVLKLGSVELKRNEKLMILGSTSVLVVVFGGLISSALYVLTTSGIIISAHGAFKEPVEVDALDQLEQEGESIVKGDIV